MSKKKADRIYVRKWLNKKEGKAFIEVVGTKKNSDPDLTVSIGDCYRHVNLEFDVYGDGDCSMKGRVYKLDLLISELQKVRQWLVGNKDNADT